MKQIHDPTRLASCVVVLGMFDGVHLGHQALLRAGRELADRRQVPLCVCTFEPHPLAVLRPEAAPPRLSLPEERAALMEQYGADFLCTHSFTHDFAMQPPQDFLARLDEIYQPAGIVCGFNYRFGRAGQGNPELILAHARARELDVSVVPCVTMDGDTVSSTRVRSLLEAGEIAQAERLLGHAYLISGTVIHGKELGRTIGFPTANIQTAPDKALPKNGVYAGCLTVRGTEYPAVVNFGRHPTLPEGGYTVEAYLPGQQLNLYGEQVTLRLSRFLRPESRFDSLQALKEQIHHDSLQVIGP